MLLAVTVLDKAAHHKGAKFQPSGPVRYGSNKLVKNGKAPNGKQTRQVVACIVGGRGISTYRYLWQAIPNVFKQGICFTDFWDAYQAVIPADRHQAVSKNSGLTNHIERFNNTIRQRLARFVRKILSFSKSDEMHLICLPLFLHSYNLECEAIIRG